MILTKHLCKCGYISNEATPVNAEDAPPSQGDITICFACGQIYRFECDLTRTPIMLVEVPHDIRAFVLKCERLRKELMLGKKVVGGKIV